MRVFFRLAAIVAAAFFAVSCGGHENSGNQLDQPQGTPEPSETLECSVDSDCAAGLVCEENKCVTPPAAPKECEKGEDCVAGFSCNLETNSCTAIAGWCDADDDCDEGYACASNQCEIKDGCKEDTDCSAFERCDVDASPNACIALTEKDLVGTYRASGYEDNTCVDDFLTAPHDEVLAMEGDILKMTGIEHLPPPPAFSVKQCEHDAVELYLTDLTMENVWLWCGKSGRHENQKSTSNTISFERTGDKITMTREVTALWSPSMVFTVGCRINYTRDN